MVESMTGSAHRVYRRNGITLDLFLKSINQRYLEVNFRMPVAFRSLEGDMKRLLEERFSRGRIDVVLESGGSFQVPVVNESVLAGYRDIFHRMGGQNADLDPLALLQLPGVTGMIDRFPEGFRSDLFLEFFEKTLLELKKARIREGKGTGREMTFLLKTMENETAAIQKRQANLRRESPVQFRRIMERNGIQAREESWEKIGPAVVEWFERFEIEEELVRLKMHFRECHHLIRKEEDPGKKLDFFFQEILREANTTGSKARDFEIKKRVVEIKSCVEKLKEQVRNLC